MTYLKFECRKVLILLCACLRFLRDLIVLIRYIQVLQLRPEQGICIVELWNTRCIDSKFDQNQHNTCVGSAKREIFFFYIVARFRTGAGQIRVQKIKRRRFLKYIEWIFQIILRAFFFVFLLLLSDILCEPQVRSGF